MLAYDVPVTVHLRSIKRALTAQGYVLKFIKTQKEKHGYLIMDTCCLGVIARGRHPNASIFPSGIVKPSD